MFHFWTADKVKNAIITMEEQIANGASQIAAPTEGSATLLPLYAARERLNLLYWAYETKTGETLSRLPQQQVQTIHFDIVPDLGPGDGGCY